MVEEERYLSVLADLHELRASVVRLEFDVISLVRAAGCSWDMIGEALGISRQAAARKYGQPRKRLV